MRKVIIGIVFFLTTIYSNTVVENNMDKGMYNGANKNPITKGKRFYFETYIKPVLNSSKRFYINEAISLEDRVKQVKNDWKIYVTVLSKTQGVILSKGTVLSNKENNAFKKTVTTVGKKAAKSIIKNITENIAKDITDNKELSKEIANNFAPIISLITVDLTTSKTPKERMAKALAVFNSTITNTAINMAGWIKAIELQSYYESYGNINLFLEEYYKCGADIDYLMNKNNISLVFEDFLSPERKLMNVVYKYLKKANPDYPGIRNKLFPLILKNISTAEEITKISLDAKRKYNKKVKILKLIGTHSSFKKINYLDDKKIYVPFIDLDYDSDNRIDKYVRLGDFYKVATTINFVYIKNDADYVYQNGGKYVTIDKAIELLDNLAKESFKKMKGVYGSLYLSKDIAPRGKSILNRINKLKYIKYTKNIGNKPIYIYRQFIQMQGVSLAKNENDLKNLNHGLRGYKAIDLLYNYQKTIEFYKEEARNENK